MDDLLKKEEEAFWGEISESEREQIAVDIARQILERCASERPSGQLDTGYLIPLAYTFLAKQEQ